MKNCPTCNARSSGKRECRRCGMDLGPLLDIREKAREHEKSALSAFGNADKEMMFHNAKRARSLFQTNGNTRLAACGALLSGRYETALSLRRSLSKPPSFL